MDIAVTGSTGLIGTELIASLEADGHRVARVVRTAPSDDEIAWDPATGQIDGSAFAGLDAVVHLAGAPIGEKRFNDDVKREIRDSRIDGTTLLAETLAGLDQPPLVLVSASGIGYYGDRGDERLTETSGPGSGFLADVCVDWEAATKPAAAAGIRTCTIRTGIVLTPKGGALTRMLPVFRFFLGGPMGGGRQYWSWISLDDHVAAIRHLLAGDVAGPVNLTAPEPVTNKQLSQALGAELGRPSFLPIPRFGPSLLLGSELARELLFTSARVLPAVLEESGFEFAHGDIETGLRAALDR